MALHGARTKIPVYYNTSKFAMLEYHKKQRKLSYRAFNWLITSQLTAAILKVGIFQICFYSLFYRSAVTWLLYWDFATPMIPVKWNSMVFEHHHKYSNMTSLSKNLELKLVIIGIMTATITHD